MNEEEIKTALRKYNIAETEIIKAIEYFNHAKMNNIPYPLYYAITKLSI